MTCFLKALCLPIFAVYMIHGGAQNPLYSQHCSFTDVYSIPDIIIQIVPKNSLVIVSYQMKYGNHFAGMYGLIVFIFRNICVSGIRLIYINSSNFLRIYTTFYYMKRFRIIHSVHGNGFLIL